MLAPFRHAISICNKRLEANKKCPIILWQLYRKFRLSTIHENTEEEKHAGEGGCFTEGGEWHAIESARGSFFTSIAFENCVKMHLIVLNLETINYLDFDMMPLT